VPSSWPALSYEAWRETCDTLHAHTQLLGKLAVELAPPQPELQHGALRLSPRGWETHSLPAPDGSGSMVVALDLHSHEAVAEHSEGRAKRVPLTPDQPVAEVTRELIAAVSELGGPVEINPKPQEVPAWTTPLDEDYEHATYDPNQVATYFAAATQAAIVLEAFRAPYRGRSTPVNAWWGTFDLAVVLFNGKPADPPADDFISRNGGDAELIQIGWWPGDAKHDGAAFFGYAHPAPDGFEKGEIAPDAAHWNTDIGEFILEWEDIRKSPDRRALALKFAQSAFQHACAVCKWDPVLPASTTGNPPPVR
jgi:Family of unknown function (DUF5996)